ncbi:MAG: hypothetical protein Q9199_007410, partial [Rusavskia elegans]
GGDQGMVGGKGMVEDTEDDEPGPELLLSTQEEDAHETSRVFPIRYTTMPTLLPKLGNISPYIEEVEDSFTPYESREPRAA